ncbi:protein HASTY 1 isoform X2 [Nymphaea colorata]|uniref:protein HASTY 1 isoform X2 n=1 Tax=Nymphaea colorata TaxID=210225 RepID=UPI00129E85AE|nr:protein HASTY 1 isoform X2 [Nymphaea colorata]
MEENKGAESVARAIIAALDYASPLDARQAAFSFLESVKQGDVRLLAGTSFRLVSRNWPPEVRLHGFKLLQHLVRLRWGELNSHEQQDFAVTSVKVITEMADPQEQWALKSQAAQLIAEVIRSEGFNLWKEILPSLNAVCQQGPTEAELIAMLLRWLPEDVTIHNEDLEGDRRRTLVRGLTQSLPDIFPLLYNLLQNHFHAAIAEAGRGQFDSAKQHLTTVIASLNAVNTYAEWAPISDLAKYGLITACGFLLSSVDIRSHACDFFKIMAPRKRNTDCGSSEFDAAMHDICSFLTKASSEFLQRCHQNAAGLDQSEYEFAECLCESMVNFGSHNLHCIADGLLLNLFLEQMLGYFQHSKLALHASSLQFWLAFLKDLLKPKVPAQARDGSPTSGQDSVSGLADKEKKGMQICIDDHIYGVILDFSFQRMVKKTASPGGALEIWNDSYDSKGDYGLYRGRMLELVRLVSSYKPVVAAVKLFQRIESVFNSCASAPSPDKDLPLLESTQLALETVVASVFDGPCESADRNSPEVQQAFRAIQDSLRQLLSLNVSKPMYLKILARHFDALGPFLKFFPEVVHGVIKILFELLQLLPVADKDPSNNVRSVRLHICTSFIRIAQTADRSLLPHMKEITETVACLHAEGRLPRGEHNILGEAFLIVASAAGSETQERVLSCLLEPISKEWTQMEWQNTYLSDPSGLVRLFMDDATMWSIFHSITFFERALKRSGTQKNSPILQSDSNRTHPFASHLPWILPPLLRLLRSVHSMWSQSVAQALPPVVQNAMRMSQTEQAMLLGGSTSKVPKDPPSMADAVLNSMHGHETMQIKENDIRNWLKGTRESGYNVLGLSTTIGDCFFKCLDSSSVALALMENIRSMNFWHLRQLTHSVLTPLVKSCPTELWDSWLTKFLLPLFSHCYQVLTYSWTNLINEGRAKIPDIGGNFSSSDLQVEVMEEQLLRSLTREICSLLSVIASPGLNACLSLLEQVGHANRMESNVEGLEAFYLNGMVLLFLFFNLVWKFFVGLMARQWLSCYHSVGLSFY